MKTYEVEFRRTSYITVIVEADNPDAAVTKAWAQLEADNVNIDEAAWGVESIEETE